MILRTRQLLSARSWCGCPVLLHPEHRLSLSRGGDPGTAGPRSGWAAQEPLAEARGGGGSSSSAAVRGGSSSWCPPAALQRCRPDPSRRSGGCCPRLRPRWSRALHGNKRGDNDKRSRSVPHSFVHPDDKLSRQLRAVM